MPIKQDIVEKLRNVNVENIRRLDLDSLNFERYVIDFAYIKEKLLECIEIAGNFPSEVSQTLEEQLNAIMSSYLGRVDSMVNLRLDKLPNTPKDAWNKIIIDTDRFIKRATTNRFTDSEVGAECDFSIVCQRLRDIQTKNQPYIQADTANFLESAKQELESLSAKNAEAKILLDALQQRSAQVATMDYAEVFEAEARKYYRKFGKPFPLVGRAQLWLTTGIVALLVIIIYVFCSLPSSYADSQSKNNSVRAKSDTATTVNNTKEDNESSEVSMVQHVVVNIIPHILLISLLLFLVRFSFKQYSISRHLYTVNIHRANILRSFNLFLQGAGKDQPEVSNALLLEVAKAIHSVGATGYVEDKSPEINIPMLEVFKTYTQKGV